MPTARVVIPATDLAALLDLPEGFQLMAGTVPAESIELLIDGPDLAEGSDVRLVYELDEMEVPSLVAIEPVQADTA